jgi:hypothetical protein
MGDGGSRFFSYQRGVSDFRTTQNFKPKTQNPTACRGRLPSEVLPVLSIVEGAKEGVFLHETARREKSPLA